MHRLRPNVCIVLKKAGSDRILLCHRKGFPPNEGWQLPQGGTHEGEDIVSEMRRELLEEIGTDNVSVLAISKKSYTYLFPSYAKKHGDKYDGQKQTWVVAEYSGDDSVINFNTQPAEFDAFIWANAQSVLSNIVDFKKEVYKQAMKDLGLL